ncbi:PREDICTED: type IV inositol polyphosphate 5-phosphatase 9 [Tarenaya hassleriana]|uniref:type IV inositol polyphosphate 5-phosphatase 9 n=1 Tax=Tarenaya hassleriana TaxID=28532 RepID=UPI00053C6F85|nr:PREDICTED: type IV inositol polyphosphate 5-phosphatase 9 [Tarenaya hassleriana]
MLGSYGEVMWPRLVANKILRKRVGSNNFVADFPTNTERLLEASTLDNRPSYTSDASFFDPRKTTHNYRVFVSTWNVGGIAPKDGLELEDLLETRKTPCDIYVTGFQEIVPLRASSVFGSENNKVSAKWNSLIREALNKRARHREGGLSESKGINGISQDFRCIISKQMVGILISVWVRNDLRPFVSHPSVSCVGCGVMGCLGNKGAVSVRFHLHETSFCFVCGHLASGGRDKDGKQRNSDVTEILARSSFPRGPSLDLPKQIMDHDRVVLLGDLNYRISLPEEKTRLLVERQEWDILLENDQLSMEIMNGHIFRGWQEGLVKFAPTYKYIPNSDVYYGCIKHDNKEEKKRSPAWCDRIIWHGNGLKQHAYTRGESKISDHRPVKAIFTVEVDVSYFRNFFLSDRFERRTNPLETHSTDHSLIPM